MQEIFFDFFSGLFADRPHGGKRSQTECNDRKQTRHKPRVALEGSQALQLLIENRRAPSGRSNGAKPLCGDFRAILQEIASLHERMAGRTVQTVRPVSECKIRQSGKATLSMSTERMIIMEMKTETKKEKRISPVAGKKEIQAFHTAVMRGEVQDYVLEGKGKEAVPVAVPASLKMRMEAAEKLEAYHAAHPRSKGGMDTAEVVRLMREMEGE